MGNSHLFNIGTGRGSATFAHWQIGLAYAKYLSPEFHVWCNQVVRDKMEGHAVTSVPIAVLEQTERTFGIVRMLAHKMTEMEKALPVAMDQMIDARIASDSRVAVVSYVSVKQILDKDFKVPPKGRRSIQRKVFVRLQNYCLSNGVKAFKCAHSGTWLFPPHEAGAFVRESCGGIIKDHLSNLGKQGNLSLVAK